MTWTATASKPRIDNDVVRIEVTFTDGVHSVIQNFSLFSVEDFNQFPLRVGQRKDQIEALLAVSDAFVSGPVAIPAVKPPTQEQIDQQAFIDARNLYRLRVKEFEATDLTGVTQTDVDDAYAVMKALYKPEYGSFI